MKNMKTQYSYGIIKYNNPYMKQESTLLDNNYKKTKYVLIEKVVHKDSSESISRILYSNDLDMLSDQVKGYITWYNYPIGIKKNIQGYISELS